MSGAGWLAVVGLGPGDSRWLTPEAVERLEAATDLVGYGPYLDRIGGTHQRRHPSDNRAELQRAEHALDLAAGGARVVVVSGGDPGIFAMATAIMESLDRASHSRWAGVEVAVIPGLSAMQAAAARAGAPLGNDFCTLSLSDNLKPWAVIERRIRLACEADFVLAFYNPISRARPWQLGAALELAAAWRTPDTPVVFATAVGRQAERVVITTLAEADPAAADMRTLVVVGASTTRVVPSRRYVYTPRWYGEDP